MWSRKFWLDLGERVVTSAAGGALAVVLAGGDIWPGVAIGAGTAALVSVLKGLAASRVGQSDSASLVD